ncbi:MAG: EAL domain-containing protein, partial [Gemmatimonadetes bacterium]|nr:EAL domain-containing protein [Gemmatimonadota bacterium]
WQHPLYGLLPPAEFIPLAEQTGLITHIGRWVLEEACGQVRRWQDVHGGDPALTLNVNVSAVQFRQPNLVQEVLRTLKRRGLAAHDLKLEITESVMMHDASSVTALRELKAMGIKIAMDDFGTGYSSLSYLRSFPFDKIKIDRSFVRDLEGDGEGGCAAIIRAVAGLGASLGVCTTAEGVETAAQLAFVRAEGCTEMQGYHLSPPRPAAGHAGHPRSDRRAGERRCTSGCAAAWSPTPRPRRARRPAGRARCAASRTCPGWRRCCRKSSSWSRTRSSRSPPRKRAGARERRFQRRTGSPPPDRPPPARSPG